MKRFFSALLAVVLIVASLATVASAVQVQPGETRSFTVTVSGDEFANYGVALSADAGVTIVGVSGATYGGGVAAWASATNVTSHSFTVTVQIADGLAPGTYNVYASVIHATKDVGVDNDTDSVKDGFVAASVSANGATFEIVCQHSWGDWTVVEKATCDKEGTEKRVCSLCGAEETRAIAKTAHNWSDWTVVEDSTCTKEGLEKHVCSICGAEETRPIALKAHTFSGWEHNAAKHWHVCSVCGEILDEADHDWNLAYYEDPTPEKDGIKIYDCICGESKTVILPYKEPQVGETRSMILMGIAAVVTTLAAASYVFKRKNVI